MTYPAPGVADAINQRFVPVQANIKEESARPVIERYRQFWTPDHRLLDVDGFELYHWNGYLPPFEFLPQLLVAQGYACLRRNDHPGAAAIYQEAINRFPTSFAAAEAQYFLAVAKYKASGQSSDLMDGWQQVRSRYPGSVWRTKQVFTESRQSTNRGKKDEERMPWS